jgi:hypothetical protein
MGGVCDYSPRGAEKPKCVSVLNIDCPRRVLSPYPLGYPGKYLNNDLKINNVDGGEFSGLPFKITLSFCSPLFMDYVVDKVSLNAQRK